MITDSSKADDTIAAGWFSAQLSEIAAIERSAVKLDEVQGDDFFVGLENIASGGELQGVVRAIDAGITSTKFAFTRDHILYGKLRPYLGKIAAPDFDGVCSTDIVPIRPGPLVDRHYLTYYLRAPAMIWQASQSAVGANLPRLSPKALESFKIWLPSIDEQRRITSILQFAESLRKRRQESIAGLASLRDSIFYHMFHHSLDWPTASLGDLVNTTSGGTPSRARPDYFRGDIPWVKSGELGGEPIESTDEAITEEAIRNSSAKLMPPGTVLLAMYGATVGEVAVLGIEAATNQAVCCLSPNESISGPYLLGFLRSRKEDLVQRASGGAQPNISQSIVRGLQIPIVPSDLQKEYGRRISVVEDVYQSARSGAIELDLLFASLQQRAFRAAL